MKAIKGIVCGFCLLIAVAFFLHRNSVISLFHEVWAYTQAERLPTIEIYSTPKQLNTIFTFSNWQRNKSRLEAEVLFHGSTNALYRYENTGDFIFTFRLIGQKDCILSEGAASVPILSSGEKGKLLIVDTALSQASQIRITVSCER